MPLDHEVDLIEVIDEGLKALYPDNKERFEAMLEVADLLKHSHQRSTGRELERRLGDPGFYKQEVIDAGLCPGCCSELERRSTAEIRPYGNTVAVERVTNLVCPQCGLI